MTDSSMIAFLPSNGSWCKQDFPHMTLVYGGPIEGRPDSDFNAMGKDAISAARALNTFSLNVIGVETLGDAGEEVDALMLYPTPQLLVARTIVEKWDTGEFPSFMPHATIGPAGSAYAEQVPVNTYNDPYEDSYKMRKPMLPSSIYFDRLAVCWGEKRLIFDLGGF